MNLNLDEVLVKKGLEEILRESKWRVEKMMKLMKGVGEIWISWRNLFLREEMDGSATTSQDERQF